MAIYLPGTAEDQPLSLEEMTPREIVAELDKYVVGQAAAKRAVAVALRNRTRRQKLALDNVWTSNGFSVLIIRLLTLART